MSPLLFIIMSEVIDKRIKEALEEHFGNTDAFLVDIKQSGGTKIEVYIDCLNSNVTIEQCAVTSRFLENILETESLVPEKYVLEVSSPGMGNPFKVLLQYKKNIGKNVTVLGYDGIKREGLLIELTDNGFVLEEHKPKSKKNKQVEIKRHDYLFEDVKSVIKLFEFPKNRA